MKEKQRAIICELSSKIPGPYQKRLKDLGFHVEEKITCIKRTIAGGPRLYRIGNCVYSLERDIADAIIVKSEAE